MEATSNGTAEAWRERITSQQASGRSIRAWCRENNQHEHAFYWWRSRLGLSPKSAGERQGRRVGEFKFAEVVVARSVGEPICLRLGGGRELILPRSMPVAELAQLVRAIEGMA
jgi:hypothetical protein